MRLLSREEVISLLGRGMGRRKRFKVFSLVTGREISELSKDVYLGERRLRNRIDRVSKEFKRCL